MPTTPKASIRRISPGWRTSCAVIALASLAACQTATPTAYQANETGTGYSEMSLGEGIYRVSFRGNSATSYRTVEDYLLYRAAEIASENGAEKFTVLRNDDPQILVESRPEGTVCHYSPADFSEFVFYPDLLEDVEPVAPETSFEAYIDVKLGSPPAGASDAQVFRTAETLEYLDSCIAGS